MFRISDYLITPKDAIFSVRTIASKVSKRDVAGAMLVVILVLIPRYVLGWGTDGSTVLVILFSVFWWRVSSRFAFSLALVCLILIPVLLILFSEHVLPYGEVWADTVAVWAYYFLVIGVLQEIAIHIRDSLRGKKRSNQIVTDIRKPS